MPIFFPGLYIPNLHPQKRVRLFVKNGRRPFQLKFGLHSSGSDLKAPADQIHGAPAAAGNFALRLFKRGFLFFRQDKISTSKATLDSIATKASAFVYVM